MTKLINRDHPDNPYPATPVGASNAKRRGWNGYFNGDARSACPFPPKRMDLQLAYEEGWDAAEANLDAVRAEVTADNISLTDDLVEAPGYPLDYGTDDTALAEYEVKLGTIYPPGVKLGAPARAAPVPLLLNCPSCGERHIDEGEFAEKPHHTHACQGCGMVWRPALIDTVGVKFLPGFKNDG